MIPIGKSILVAFSSMTAFALWKFFQLMYHELTSPLRNLCGPEGSSWIYGNMQDIWNAENSAPHEEWAKQYGTTLVCKGFFYTNRLFTMDTQAINHILTNSKDYQKPHQLKYYLSQTIGPGLVIVEGAQHRQQRNIMVSPAFGTAQIRALTNIFFQKAVGLRDIWSSKFDRDHTRGIRLDMMQWSDRITLDIIGLAGFGFNIDSLNANEKPNELSEAFGTIATVGKRLGILSLLQVWIPLLRLLPSDRARQVQVAQCTIARIGKQLLSDAKKVARESVTEIGKNEMYSLHGRDLLSLLVKANIGTDIPEHLRLSDDDVLAQVPTFFVTGHETISTATTWAFYAMSIAPKVQTKLREELLTVDTETPSMDELMALPYLDSVIKETLRVHAPVPCTTRIAMKDDVLLVQKPFKDKNGVVHDSIRISKGDRISIPILAINRLEELWGPDAREFKPERWENVPEAVSRVPGVWGHLLTFLGGPRACIGYRFSLVEMKALLFTLVRAFEFELAVPVSEIGKKTSIVQRPVVRSDLKNGAQLPLLIKPYKQT